MFLTKLSSIHILDLSGRPARSATAYLFSLFLAPQCSETTTMEPNSRFGDGVILTMPPWKDVDGGWRSTTSDLTLTFTLACLLSLPLEPPASGAIVSTAAAGRDPESNFINRGALCVEGACRAITGPS